MGLWSWLFGSPRIDPVSRSAATARNKRRDSGANDAFAFGLIRTLALAPIAERLARMARRASMAADRAIAEGAAAAAAAMDNVAKCPSTACNHACVGGDCSSQGSAGHSRTPGAALPRPSIASGAGGKGDPSGCVTAFTFAMPGPRHKRPQSRSGERANLGDRDEDDPAGVFSRRVGGSCLRRAEAVAGEEMSRARRPRGPRRRRRAKPRRPAPGAALQRLHDGLAILIGR
jgi:hypothetical protein